MTPEAAFALCRFFHDASLMVLFGAYGFLCALVPARLGGEVATRLERLRLGAAIVVALAALLVVPVQTALIGDGWGDATQWSSLRDVVSGTPVGMTLAWQGGGALLLLALSAARPGLRRRGTVIVAGLLLAALSREGHAVMDEGWTNLAHRANDALHVVAAGAWFGALIPLSRILRRYGEAPLRAEAIVALRRFSFVGHGVVAIVALTGIANMLFILGWPTGWATPYRLLLAAKIAVAGTMVVLAVINRYVFVPALRRDPGRALMAIRRGTAGEIALGLAAILLVAIFGTLDPG